MAAAAQQTSKPGPAPQSSFLSGKLIWALVGIVLGLVVAFLPAPKGLDTKAMINLGVLVWAIVYWATGALPDYVTALVMAFVWIVGLKIPSNVALGAFNSTTQWLLLSALVFAGSLIKTGLVRRISLWLLKVLPATYFGQVLALMLAGIVMGPVVPNGIGKVTMLGPVAMGMAEQTGYEPRSAGMNGLTLAVWAGAVPVATLAFMTGGAPNLAIFAAVPAAARAEITWSGWFIAALPMALLTAVLLFIALLRLYRPEKTEVNKENVTRELAKMGPMSRQEIITAVVLLTALVLWITGGYHKIDTAWVAVGGATALLLTNVLDRMAFRNSVDWALWIYVGLISGIGPVMQALKIDAYVKTVAGPALSSIAANPYLFLALAVVLTFIGRLLFANLITTGVLLVVILGPIAQSVGIHPFIVALTGISAGAVWILPYINPMYLALYSATQEKGFTHAQARKLNWVFMAICLVGVLISVPYWQMLGLIK